MCWSDFIARAGALSCLPAPLCDARRLRVSFRFWLLLLPLLAAASTGRSEAAFVQSVPLRGLPFTRHYSFGEIGNVSRGGRIAFDHLGRVAIIQDGAYVVLNDTTWLDIADRDESGPNLMNVVLQRPGGLAYYGAYDSFGVAEFGLDGRIRPRPLISADRPDWVIGNNFTDIVGTKDGVYFAGRNGVVFLDPVTSVQKFFEVPGTTRIFSVGDRIYVSSSQQAVSRIDVESETVRPILGADFGGVAVDQATSLDNGRALVALFDGRMLVFDGVKATPWEAQQRFGLSGRVSALHQLEDDALAVAVNGRGLYFFSSDGDLQLSLTAPDFQSITSLAENESGVLWAATETGIEKILYGTPVSRFGQALGLPVSWPQVVRWNNTVVIATSGVLYQPAIQSGSGITHFEPMPNQPLGIWGVAARGVHLLVGCQEGVFSYERDGSIQPVLPGLDVSRLVMVDDEICFAIGASEIGVLRWNGQRWAECAPRVPGFGYPAIVHATKTAAWVELGPNRAARISMHGGGIRTRMFDRFPWSGATWINIGVVEDTAILCGPPGRRLFFDEKTEELCEAPELKKLLDQAPYSIQRIGKDDNGLLWASYEHGILAINTHGGSPSFSNATFDVFDGRSPRVQLLEGGDVWISTGFSLYHMDQPFAPPAKPTLIPLLVSVLDVRSNQERSIGTGRQSSPFRVPYEANDLRFRFFAGSYASYRSPAYEFRFNQEGNAWRSLGGGSLLNFSELSEGRYFLEVRVKDISGEFGSPASFSFEILPPWYRTIYAYALYGATAVLSLVGLVRWAERRSRARNLILEKLVQDRTNELRSAMQKLNEETRNAATLAERDRLACEIHDSLQQGLSGLIIQLDTMLKMPVVTPDVRSRLAVARNMVSFTRHELQHAVWNMESPLLEGSELDEALRNLTGLIGLAKERIRIEVTGSPWPLSSESKHHLLRIAQEAITNAVRHAACSTVTIRLDYQPQEVALTVSDDGRGFDPSQVLANGFGHFGLRGLRGRAAKIGGDLQIQSSPGKGTTVRVVAPTTNQASSPLLHAATPNA